MPTRDVYEADFRTAGFSIIEISDMSDDWRQFTHERYESFILDRQRQESVHGKELVAGLDSFYGAVARLFKGGHLGGLRLLAKNIAEFF